LPLYEKVAKRKGDVPAQTLAPKARTARTKKQAFEFEPQRLESALALLLALRIWYCVSRVMSSLQATDRRILEEFLGMSFGYVLNFSDYTFGEFVCETVGLDIHSGHYTGEGTSKAKKLRAFWKLESDQTVGKLLLALI
jgi:hypothetical protein